MDSPWLLHFFSLFLRFFLKNRWLRKRTQKDSEVKPAKETKKSSSKAQVKSKGKKENCKWIEEDCKKKTEIDGDIIVPGDNIMLDPGAEDTE